LCELPHAAVARVPISKTGDRDLFQRWFQGALHSPKLPPQREISKAVAKEPTSRTVAFAQVPKFAASDDAHMVNIHDRGGDALPRQERRRVRARIARNRHDTRCIWFERCGLNDPRLDSKEHYSTAISNSFLQRFERGTLLGWLRPLCRKSAKLRLAGAQAFSADAERRRGCDSLLARDHVGERLDEMTEELMASSGCSPDAPNEIA
jgi:hypothetical protein